MMEVTEQEAREACSKWTLEAMQHLVERGRDIKVATVIAWAMQEFARRDEAAKSRDAFELAGLRQLLSGAEPGTFMHRQLVDRIESKKREISMGCTEQDARDAAARLADGDYPIGKDGVIAQIKDEGTVHAWATRIMGYDCPPSTPLTREWFHENGNDVSMICVFGDNCEYQFEAAAGEPSIGVDLTTVVGGGAMHIATLPTVRTVGQLCALMAALLRPVRNSAQYIPEDDGGENTAHILSWFPTPSTKHMERQEREDGINVMLSDLHRLASEDGCIAAAWALELAEQVAKSVVAGKVGC